MRDEQEYRREEGFRPGTNITLADGQAWVFPSPMTRFVPDESDRGFTVVIANLGEELGDRFSAALADYEREGDTGFESLVKTELTLASCLLLSNYDLTPSELRKLLQFAYRPDDTEGTRIRQEVMSVVFGTGGPKPSAVGDE